MLKTDRAFPNVATLVTGEAIKGSWWKHSKSHEIFAVLEILADRQDILLAKLLSNKDTLIHKRLWPDLLNAAQARDPWQTTALSPAAKFLLQKIDSSGSLRSDRVTWPTKFRSEKVGDVVRELESRLLIHIEEIHTDRGSHAKLLESWEHWAERWHLNTSDRSPAESRKTLEALVRKINQKYGADACLPWIRISDNSQLQ